MKLTKDDKNYLKKIGYEEVDFPQIEKAISIMKYMEYYSCGCRKVSRKYVLENMTRQEWLSSVGRAAFHRTACRETIGLIEIRFDAEKLFEK